MINSDSALFKCHDTASAAVLWDGNGDKALGLVDVEWNFSVP
jgi:hypothetical protein